MVKQVDCTECEFLIRNEDSDQLIEFVQKHAQESHDMAPSRADVEGWMTEV